MARLSVDLPEDLVQRLLETALADDRDEQLYRAALAVEQDAALNADMAEWEQATASDGFEPQS